MFLFLASFVLHPSNVKNPGRNGHFSERIFFFDLGLAPTRHFATATAFSAAFAAGEGRQRQTPFKGQRRNAPSQL
jgi:hypothetical protein